MHACSGDAGARSRSGCRKTSAGDRALSTQRRARTPRRVPNCTGRSGHVIDVQNLTALVWLGRCKLGLEVRVLQNNSRHGVDLYAYDPIKNQYLVFEVKSSSVNNFKMTDVDAKVFLETRAERAKVGEGVWSKTPEGIKQAGTEIVDNLSKGAKVVGFKIEVAVPKQGQSGVPVVAVKKW